MRCLISKCLLPCQEALDACTKEQLLLIAEHYSVVIVGDKQFKENIKAAMRSKLTEVGIMNEDRTDSPTGAAALSFRMHGLSFELQKEILLLQMEHDKMKHEVEIKKQLGSVSRMTR